MSLIFCDGFDDGLAPLGKWTLFGSHNSLTSGGRNGNKLVMSDSGTPVTILSKTLTANAHATMIWGCAIQAPNVTAFNNGFQSNGHVGSIWGDAGATQHVSISIIYNGGASTVEARRGSASGTSLGSASISTLLANQWYYVEAKVVASNTVGTVEVRINGATVLNLTGLDTLNGGTNTTYDTLTFEGNNANAGRDLWFDDIYWCNGAGSTNNDFLGDIAVETLYPDGNGSSSQFTGSDGNSTDNYLLVDEASPSTTDYVQNGTNGQRDLYTYAALTRTTGTVYGVQTTAYAQKIDSGDRSLKNVAKSSSVSATSSAFPLATTWLPKSSVFESDPNTASPWTVSTVNAAEFGIETSA